MYAVGLPLLGLPVLRPVCSTPVGALGVAGTLPLRRIP